MEWYLLLGGFIGGLLVLLLIRVPVAFALFAVTLVATWTQYGFEPGNRMLALSTLNALKSFNLVPIALFIFMGDLLFRFGIASRALETLGLLFGKVPARLGLLTTASGGLFGVLSGSSIANTALLGRTFYSDMRLAGYRDTLAIGTVLAGGGLAMVIPPSTVAIIWAVTAGVPVGPFLIAGFVPGIMMMIGYGIVTMVWGKAFKAAPEVESAAHGTARERWRRLVTDVLPLGLIVFAALGVIFLGWATPSEASGLGVAAAVVLAVAYRKFDWRGLLLSMRDSAGVSGMILLIFASSGAYSQLMSFSGATNGFISMLLDLTVSPFVLLILIQIGILILGTFLEQIAIILVTVPLLMPVVSAMGWDPIWFGIIMLVNLQIALTTPPFGMGLFVMKGVVPKSVRMTRLYRAAIPFVLTDITIMFILMLFPDLINIVLQPMSA